VSTPINQGSHQLAQDRQIDVQPHPLVEGQGEHRGNGEDEPSNSSPNPSLPRPFPACPPPLCGWPRPPAAALSPALARGFPAGACAGPCFLTVRHWALRDSNREQAVTVRGW